jgi:hypothetical protein
VQETTRRFTRSSRADWLAILEEKMQGTPRLPEVLTKKLVFGDPEQIAALRKYEEQCREFYGGDGEKRWNVFVEVDYSATIGVTASTEEEAIEKAKDQFDAGDFINVSFHAKIAPDC